MLPHMNLLGFFHTEKPKKKFFLNNPITKNQKPKNPIGSRLDWSYNLFKNISALARSERENFILIKSD